MEDVSEWKYPKLLNRAKALGIVFDTAKVATEHAVDRFEWSSTDNPVSVA